MGLLGRVVIAAALFGLGWMTARGDVSCRVSPEALSRLRDAGAGVLDQATSYAHGQDWGRRDGSPTPLGRDLGGSADPASGRARW